MYTPEELQAIEELRIKNKKRNQREYYLKVTKRKRVLSRELTAMQERIHQAGIEGKLPNPFTQETE